MEIERKTKPANNFTIMTFLTLHCLYKYANANGKARVTATLMFCNVLTYFRRPGLITDALLPTIDQVWINYYRFLKHKEQKRFYFSQFYHFRRNHFLYDMLKLLWNGVELEPKMGWIDYATMFGSLVFISQNINLVGRYLVMLAGKKWIYKDEKMVGCTNVMFALDYVRNSMREGDRYVFGYRVPRYLSPWIELIVAKKVGAGDLLGNLGGVLAGIVYLKLKSSNRGPDPIAEMIRSLFGLGRSDNNFQVEDDSFIQYIRRLERYLEHLYQMQIQEAAARNNYGELLELNNRWRWIWDQMHGMMQRERRHGMVLREQRHDRP